MYEMHYTVRGLASDGADSAENGSLFDGGCDEAAIDMVVVSIAANHVVAEDESSPRRASRG